MNFQLIHLGKGSTYVSEAPRQKPTRMAQAAALLAERRRMDAEHRAELTGLRELPAASYGPVPLLHRHYDQCAFMLDDVVCCGSRVVTGKSWCPEHYRIVFDRHEP